MIKYMIFDFLNIVLYEVIKYYMPIHITKLYYVSATSP